MPDPGVTRTALTNQSDHEAMALRQLLAGWQETDSSGAGMTVAEVLRLLADNPDSYDTLRGALWELSPPKDGKTLNPRSIGMKLHHLRQRVVGGSYLDRRESQHGAIWKVGQSEIADTKGTNDTKSPLNAAPRAGRHATCPNRPELVSLVPLVPCTLPTAFTIGSIFKTARAEPNDPAHCAANSTDM